MLQQEDLDVNDVTHVFNYHLPLMVNHMFTELEELEEQEKMEWLFQL